MHIGVEVLWDPSLSDLSGRPTRYIQQQQINGYQSEEDLFCVLATYDVDQTLDTYSVPGFAGGVVGVYNYANEGSVNGVPMGSANGTVLCARAVGL